MRRTPPGVGDAPEPAFDHIDTRRPGAAISNFSPEVSDAPGLFRVLRVVSNILHSSAWF